jgi:hydroxymethylpyrimidine/phosphomethylpyrimidine kinase
MTVLRLASGFDILHCKFCCNCQGVNVVPEDFVGEQLKSVLSDMEVDVVS